MMYFPILIDQWHHKALDVTQRSTGLYLDNLSIENFGAVIKNRIVAALGYVPPTKVQTHKLSKSIRAECTNGQVKQHRTFHEDHIPTPREIRLRWLQILLRLNTRQISGVDCLEQLIISAKVTAAD